MQIEVRMDRLVISVHSDDADLNGDLDRREPIHVADNVSGIITDGSLEEIGQCVTDVVRTTLRNSVNNERDRLEKNVQHTRNELKVLDEISDELRDI